MINLKDQLLNRFGGPVSDRFIRSWFHNKNMFFVLGMGRSGTQFLAELLNHDDSANVFHEPVREDFDAFVKAHKSNEAALNYIKSFRRRKMFGLVKRQTITSYGEVNSALRYHASALKAVFPQAKLLHLVRDGRDVVRSVMARQHYTASSSAHHELSPAQDDPLFDTWCGLSRFEKICWLWVDANRRLRQNIEHCVRFEQLVNDYAYFRDQLEHHLGVQIGQTKWSDAVNKPSNTTQKFALPAWQKWDSSLIKTFDRICGDEMKQFGYF